MKRIGLCLALLALAPVAVSAQIAIRPVVITTMADLPGTATDGFPFVVTDATSATDCTTGGGTSIAFCAYDASAAGYVALSGGGGTDGTCNDAGVTCLFAGSASEGGPAASALDLSCTGCVAASEVAADVATQAELDGLDTSADDLSDNSVTDLSDVAAVSGNTTTLATTSGTLTSGNLAAFDAAGNIVDSGGTGGGAPAFSDLTSGTNTTAAMVVGTGGSFKISGSGTVDASGVDADGDGTRELTVSGGQMDLSPAESVAPVLRLSGGESAANKQVEINHSFGFAFVRSGTASAGLVLRAQGSGYVKLDGIDHVAMRTGAGYATESYRCNSTRCTTSVARSDAPSPATCASSGDAGLGTLFISAGTSYAEVTNSDPDGCTLTIGEPSAGGQHLTLALVATAGGVVTLADTPGTINLSADWTPGVGDTLQSIYSLTRSEWLETSRSDN